MSEETKEVKIAIPEGYEIDTEKSTFTNIVFKKKCLSWLARLKRKCHNAYVTGYTISECLITSCFKDPIDMCVFANKKQARSARAYATITQIMKNDDRFGGEIRNEEWSNDTVKYIIERFDDNLRIGVAWREYKPLAFHTAEQRDLFKYEYDYLIRDYYMID